MNRLNGSAKLVGFSANVAPTIRADENLQRNDKSRGRTWDVFAGSNW